MNASLTILGSNSALPAHGRHPSAQLLIIGKNHILIDCGEGTQFQFNKYRLSKMKVSHIFISHLHGDHVFGLPGFLTSLILLSRTEPIIIIGPVGIKKMMEQIFEATSAHFTYEIDFIETDTENSSIILNNENFTVENIPLKHKIPCNGYLFREKPKQKNIRSEIIEKYGLNPAQIISLKNNEKIQMDKGELTPEEALYIKHTPKSYAYCSDTSYLPGLSGHIQDIDLLYHEATYLKDFTIKAAERGHSTASQAAQLAKDANVKKLLIGHPSSKYADVQPLVDESLEIFSNTEFAFEGKTFEL